MEFRQLKYFVAVAKCGSIGLAAKTLHVSQPPVTRQIHALEEALGLPLFVRNRHGVALTNAGAAFLPEAQRILSIAQGASAVVRSAGTATSGHLRLAYVGTTIYQVVPDLLRSFHIQFPEVTVDISLLSKTSQLQALRDGSLDVGFGRYYQQESRIKIEHLGEEKLEVAYSSGTLRKPRGDEMKLAQLKSLPLILYPNEGRPSFADQILDLLKSRGIVPHVAGSAADASAALALVASGLGVAVVPASVGRLAWSSVRFARLVDHDATVPLSCVYASDLRSPVVKSFLESIHARSEKYRIF